MKSVLMIAIGLLLMFGAYARTVTSGTVVANPGASVVVPVTIDDVSDVSVAMLTVNYDATVVVCLGVEAGELVDATRMSYVDSGGGNAVVLMPELAKESGGGELVRIRFSVREGTQGLYSDVTLANVEFASKDGVTDLEAKTPLSVESGMIRVVGTEAEVKRLEGPFTVWPETKVKSLTFGTGDAVRASDGMTTPIEASVSVAAAAAIPVLPPAGGWQTGRYALLKTPTTGLRFEVGQGDSEVSVVTESEGGMTIYCLDVTVEGEVEIVADEGELAAETKSRVRGSLADLLAANPSVTKVIVKGEKELVPLVADLGIRPKFTVSGSIAEATYAKPSLRIVEFEKKTGRIRVKVTPGAENEIRSALATGCLHIYGADELTDAMELIEGAVIDLAPYLKEATKGEADITVTFGSRRFFRVKAGAVK